MFYQIINFINYLKFL